jgi:superfamily II DNA or RNA helicase
MLVKDKQAICYCVNVKHSQETCEMFNKAKISAVHMDAKTPEKEREKILEDFKNKKFKILCNCNLISEGITLEGADVALLLRKTASMSLYIQQACRCLTPVQGKEATIIDFVRKCV